MDRPSIVGTNARRAAAVGAVGVAAAASGIAWSRYKVPHNLDLPPAVPGERREIQGRAGRLHLSVDGEGPPLVLLHSINAAASAYEVRPIFDRMRATRRVYAPDLPGFGFSDRSDRDYSIRLYVDAVHDVLDHVAQEHPGEGVDALALSLTCEFLARAVTEGRDEVARLVFVTPTGFSRASDAWRGPRGSSREIPGFYRAFTVPLWSQAVFDLLASRRSIRFFLQRTFGSKMVDEGLLDYDYLTSHQPGARHAPLAFVSGRLFGADVRTLYEELDLPIWMPHATKGDFKDFSGADWLEERPNWIREPFDTGALPQFEVPDRFNAALERFLDDEAPALRAPIAGAEFRPPPGN